jgi:hypothetical protein
MIETLSSSVLAWLLTYLIHSTVLLGLALVLTRARAWAPTALDLMWKTALVGSLATSTVQHSLEVRPAGSIALRPAEGAPDAGSPTSPYGLDAAAARSDARRGGEGSLASEPAAAAAVGAPEASRAMLPSLHSTAVLAWALVALVLGLSYAARRLILVGRIGDRDEVLDECLLAELDLLTHREPDRARRVRGLCARDGPDGSGPGTAAQHARARAGAPRTS